MTKDEIMELAKSVQLADNGMITAGDYTEELCKLFRLAYARGMLKQAEQGKHWSDCAVNSEPAYPAGECDCGGHSPIVRAWSGLSDREMTECIVVTCNTDDGTADTRDLIRAVEAKLKEKNT